MKAVHATVKTLALEAIGNKFDEKLAAPSNFGYYQCMKWVDPKVPTRQPGHRTCSEPPL